MPHALQGRKGLKLDDHQREALEELYEGLNLNRRKMCAVASCGSGKTLIEIAAVSASQAAKEELGINNERKDIIVTEGRAVVTGIRRQFENLGIETGVWSGGKRELEPPIIVAGVHALQMAQAQDELYEAFGKGKIDFCGLDEVDRFLTRNRIDLITEAIRPRIIAGFTATKDWPDGRHISDCYGPVVHELKLAEAMGQRINVIPELFVYQSEIKEEDLKLRRDDYDPTILAAAWKHAEIHKAVPQTYKHMLPVSLRRECPALVYVPSRDLVRDTAETMQQELPDIKVVGITGEDDTDTVDDATDGFMDGDIQVIVLCEIGGRGMNLENAKLLIDAYPTKSLNKLQQRHGRVLRKIRPGSTLWKKGWRKKDALIAQIIPKANRFRPALFTDLLGGYKELQRIRGECDSDSTGTPESDLVSQVREHIESQNPPVHLTLIDRVQVLESLMRDLPQADKDGFFWLPKRYVQEDELEKLRRKGAVKSPLKK